MKFKSIITGLFLSITLFSATEVNAQQTYEEIEQLTVNEQVTTVITASEPIRFVDISTDLVAGDQPINNTVRLKPKDSGYVHEPDWFGGGDDCCYLFVDCELFNLLVGLLCIDLGSGEESNGQEESGDYTFEFHVSNYLLLYLFILASIA